MLVVDSQRRAAHVLTQQRGLRAPNRGLSLAFSPTS
jgi:hypothetical protein